MRWIMGGKGKEKKKKERKEEGEKGSFCKFCGCYGFCGFCALYSFCGFSTLCTFCAFKEYYYGATTRYSIAESWRPRTEGPTPGRPQAGFLPATATIVVQAPP